jgi:hypothetical protein
MSHPYSKRFLAGDFNGASGSAVCPAGKVWVVKAVDLIRLAPSVTTTFSMVLAGVTVWGVVIDASGAPFVSQWRGMQVIGPGEAVQIVVASVARCHAMVSGYELTN